MKKEYLLFYVCALMSFVVFQIPELQQIEVHGIFVLIAVMLLGIPHGANDHVIYRFKFVTRKRSRLFFYAVYLFLYFIVIVVWIMNEVLGFAFLLACTAYHFGEGQLHDIGKLNKYIQRFSYALWGTLYLSILFFHGKDNMDFGIIGAPLVDQALMQISASLGATIMISAHLVFFLFAWHLYRHRMTNLSRLLSEGIVLILLHLISIALPPLIAFALYFICIHSVSTLHLQYDFLKKKNSVRSIVEFARKLIPYTLLSVIGSCALYLLNVLFNSQLELSLFLLIFGTISALTFPHSIVMSRLLNDT